MPLFRTKTIARQFLGRTLPPAALLMAAIWLAAALFVERTLRSEAEHLVERASSNAAVRIRNRLVYLVETLRTHSGNELLVTGLLDQGWAAVLVPAYLRSLRLPGISTADFALLDYAGAVIASSVPMYPNVSKLGDVDIVELSSEGLRITLPVRYNGLTEGYIVSWVGGSSLQEAFAADLSNSLGQTTVRLGDDILAFGGWHREDAAAIHSEQKAVQGFPDLTVEISFNQDSLFPAAVHLNWYLMAALGADLLVLVGVSLFSAAAAARPLRRMMQEIKQVPPETLHLDGYDKAPREIRFLSSTLNAIAKRIASETQRRMEALQQAQDHAARNDLLAAVIEHSTNGITISDARAPGRPFIYANPAFFSMTGYEPAEVIGRRPDSLNWKERTPEDTARLHDAVAAGRELRLEMRDFRKDGSNYWNLQSLYPVRDASGAVSHVIGVQIDITEQRRMREAMARTAHLTSLGELATGLAHELNQPLNVIRLASLNLSAQLEDESVLSAAVTSKLQRIQRNIDRASTIIEHMKIFSRGDSGPPAPFRLGNALDGALQIIGSEMRNAGIDVRRHPENDDPFVHGRPIAVEQVVLNLALNARDAIIGRREGGDPAHDEWIEFGIAVRGSMAVLSVEDTGGGIPETLQAQIFEPFFTTKPTGKGVGLGLSTSFGIATELGGTLIVSNATRGARFELSLPLATRDGPSASTTPAAGAAS